MYIVYFLLFLAFVLICAAIIMLLSTIYDPYGMGSARLKYREFCEGRYYLLEKLSAIIDKMKDCPPIAKDASPTEVYVWCNVHILIFGDRKGRPLMVFLGHPLDKETAKNPIFRMYCHIHGMSASTAETYMGILSKENFKEQIKEKEENSIKSHFTV